MAFSDLTSSNRKQREITELEAKKQKLEEEKILLELRVNIDIMQIRVNIDMMQIRVNIDITIQAK